MTIEEKAKAYDEVIERVNSKWKYKNQPCVVNIAEIFPELKESEDEMTRKAIIEFVKSRLAGFPECKRFTDWLEKQKVLTTEENLQGKEDVLWCIKQATKHAKDENEMGTCWFAEKWLEKQGKQKTVLNNEDESIRKGLIEHLKELKEQSVEGSHLKRPEHYDAWIAWLEKQTTPQVRTGLEWENTIDDACDARYTEEYSHDEYCHEQSFKWGFKEGVDWLEKQGEQKSAWSEEDENKVNNLCVFLDQMVSFIMLGNKNATEFKDWLKSLKYRVQSQRSIWTKGDDVRFTSTMQVLEYSKSTPDYNQYAKDDIRNNITWLKSLKDRVQSQSRWKPSDEQIKAVRLARSFVTDDLGEHLTLSETLVELEEQLKKLREE